MARTKTLKPTHHPIETGSISDFNFILTGAAPPSHLFNFFLRFPLISGTIQRHANSSGAGQIEILPPLFEKATLPP
jgi:hypothetical protein